VWQEELGGETAAPLRQLRERWSGAGY